MEKEKMLSGFLYDSTVKSLADERIVAEELSFKFNNLPPSKNKEKSEILKKLFGKVGKNVFVRSTLYCDYGYNIEVGDNFYANHNLTILDCAKVKFGDNVLIAPNCGFYTAEHPLDVKTRNKGLEYAKPIIVGNNVWIGGGVQVIAGVTIGNNVVVAAGAVVTKDIPDNCVVAGVPAEKIKDIENV